MKLMGLIGGISPESTAIYYRLLNAGARARLGGKHSAALIVWSFDFQLLDTAYAEADWDHYRALLVGAGERLKRAGAEALMICSNTSHLGAGAVEAATGLPLIHVVDALGRTLSASGARAPLLLGTPFVMEGEYYRAELGRRFAIAPLVPDPQGRREVGRIIFEELVRGVVSPDSRARLRAIIESARKDGADGVILGCTELSMILAQADVEIPVFDTTALHADAALDFMLRDE